MRSKYASVGNPSWGGSVGIASAALKLGGGGGGCMKRLRRAAALMALICVLFAVATAPTQAQDRWLDLPAPTGVAAVNGANPGEAIISWQPVAGAAFYRIAWIAAADAAAIAENGGGWLGSYLFTDIVADPADSSSELRHTLTRLNPGVRYIFQVGSRRVKTGTPSWSRPAELYLAPGDLAADLNWTSTVPVGLTVNEPGASGGYTLFANRWSGIPYLIDHAGRLVHRWEHSIGSDARLLANGNVMGRTGGLITEVNPSGDLVWSYRHPQYAHHDFVILPNGNVLLLVRETKTLAEAIAAGANPAFVPADGLVSESIVEVRPIDPDRAEVVWRWSVWDHLVQDYDATKANFGRVAAHPELIDLNYHLRQLGLTERIRNINWLHANGLDYHPGLDQIVISARNMSEIWVIDHSTTTAEAAGHSGGNSGRGGDLIYRWGNPQAYRAGTYADQQLFWQHNPRWIPEGLPGAGNILIFSNGDEFEGRYLEYSEIVEITPPVEGYGYARREGAGLRYGPAQPAWTYQAAEPGAFLSYRLSGAQRLPNGNTQMVSGLQGVIFEVTPAGATVWRYVSPVVPEGPIYQGDPLPASLGVTGRPVWRNALYRAYWYAPDYPGLQHYDLTPQGTVERYRDGTAGR